MKTKVLTILMSLAMVFTMIPMMGSAAYADDSEEKSGTITLSGDVNKLQDQYITFKRLYDSRIDPSKIIETNFTNSGDYSWSIAKADLAATTVMLTQNGTEATEFHDLTRNDHIKLVSLGSGSERLLFSATGSDFGREINIYVRAEDVAPSLGDDENITVKVGKEETIGDLSKITDDDGNSYILHGYNYQVGDYDKDIVTVTNLTAKGDPATHPDDYVTALKVTGKKPGSAVVEVTLCNIDKMPVINDQPLTKVLPPRITKKYNITVLGDENPDPERPKVYGTLLAKATAKGKSSLRLSWNRVEGAAGYDIFFARCDHRDKKLVCKKVKTIKGNSTFRWTRTGLKKGTAYKSYVRAYVYKNGKKSYVSKSPTMHAFTGNGNKNYTNARSVTIKNVKNGKLTLTKDKSFKIKARVNKINKKKKLVSKKHAPKLRYLTTNSKVATVTKGGKITAKGIGTCTIVAFAHNGVSKKVKVTVK